MANPNETQEERYLRSAENDAYSLRKYEDLAQLPSQGGEAVEVVGYHNPISKDWSYVGRVGWEPLMTVAQHQRILAAATHPADQVAEGVRLEGLTDVNHQLGMLYLHFKNTDQLHVALRELRALLAKSEGVKT